MAWTYEQTFDSLTSADLNGQDSWTGDTEWDVQSSVILEGSKSVGAAANASVDKTVSRTITGVTDGTMYITGRQSAATGGARLNIQLLSGSTVLCWIRARNTDDTHWDWYHGGTSSTTFSTLAVDTNYRFGIRFDCATNQYQVNVNNGAFTTLDTFYNNNTATTIDTIKIFLENGTYNAYFDYISPNYSHYLTDNLVSYWKLDESSGNASDSVGSNTLTNSNVTYAAGKINNGSVFNGTSASLTGGDVFDFNYTGEITFSYWVKPTNFTGNQQHLNKKNPSGAFEGWQIYTNGSGVLNFDYAAPNGTGIEFVTNSAVLSAGVWQHVAFSYNNKVLVVYINGVSVGITKTADTVTQSTDNSINFNIGSRGNTDRWFNGSIDEVGIWTRALTANEVSQLYSGGNGIQYAFAGVDNIIAYDNSTDGGSATATSLTFSHVCSGTNRILFVSVVYGSTDSVTGATYNGVSMTLIGKAQRPSSRWTYLFGLINPTIGTNNVVVSNSSSDYITAGAVSYTGAKQTGQPDAFTASSFTAQTTMTTAVTVVASNCWITGFGYGTGTGTGVTGGSGTVRRTLFDASGGASQGCFDSNVIVATGSVNMNVLNNGGSTSANGTGIFASFAPAVSTSTGNFLMFM